MQENTKEIHQIQQEIEKITNEEKASFGQIMSDKVAATVGSWKFIIAQSTIIIFWIIFNTQIAENGFLLGNFLLKPWDPYPFIFLNLTLSFQAAYTAPIIMMSQNRQSQVDRLHAEQDYQINREAKEDVERIEKEVAHVRQVIANINYNPSQHGEIKSEISLLSQDLRQITNYLDDLKGLLTK